MLLFSLIELGEMLELVQQLNVLMVLLAGQIRLIAQYKPVKDDLGRSLNAPMAKQAKLT